MYGSAYGLPRDRGRASTMVCLAQNMAINRGTINSKEGTIGKPQGNIIPYIGPYLIGLIIAEGESIKWLSILITFLCGLVTPTTVYESQAAAGVSFVEERRAFFAKARFGIPKPCLRLTRWPQALFFFRKTACLFEKCQF